MSPLLENKTILVVDDNEDIRYLLKTILEQAGATVSAAKSVREAIDVLHEAEIERLWRRGAGRELGALLNQEWLESRVGDGP